jgi:lysophospholipase L1-like esterase
VIIIQAVTTFGRVKAREYHYMVPQTIMDLNERLESMVEGEQMRFIDFNPQVMDEEGYLPADWSSDGCHPSLAGYRQWSQWIFDTAAELRIPEKEEKSGENAE